MADYYTQTAFALRVDAAEADILPEIDDVLNAIQTGFESPEDALAFWQSCSVRFRQLFPADDPNRPFEHFTALFSDETYPSHGAEITCSSDPSREGGAILDISGDSVDPYALAGLLRILLPSALPFRFGWAETCSRMRADSFGGGFLEVSADRTVPLHSLGQDLDRQHLVVVVKDPACGLLFWNNKEGFGPLKTATVITQREADAVRLPYAGVSRPGGLNCRRSARCWEISRDRLSRLSLPALRQRPLWQRCQRGLGCRPPGERPPRRIRQPVVQ